MQFSLSNRSEHTARLLENNLGGFIEIPKASDKYYSSYFRIKVWVDITKPLKSGMFFQGVVGNKQWVQIIYERLPTFCFLYGIRGHREVYCLSRYEEDFVDPVREFPYGNWMRVNAASRKGLVSLTEVQQVMPIEDSTPMARTGSEIWILYVHVAFHRR